MAHMVCSGSGRGTFSPEFPHAVESTAALASRGTCLARSFRLAVWANGLHRHATGHSHRFAVRHKLRHRRPDLPSPFKTPLVPLVRYRHWWCPCCYGEPVSSRVSLVLYARIGMVIYFTYREVYQCENLGSPSNRPRAFGIALIYRGRAR